MPDRRPLIAYTLVPEVNPDEGPQYGVYTDAYGLEMTIDDEWPVDTVLLVPPKLAHVPFEETGVTEMGVQCGASSAPADGNFSGLARDDDPCWVLLGETDNVAAAAAAGLSILLCVSDASSLVSLLDQVNIESGKIAVAVNSVEAAVSARTILDASGKNASRVLLAENASPGTALELIENPDVDGLLLTDSTYGIVVDILAAIADGD